MKIILHLDIKQDIHAIGLLLAFNNGLIINYVVTRSGVNTYFPMVYTNTPCISAIAKEEMDNNVSLATKVMTITHTMFNVRTTYTDTHTADWVIYSIAIGY